MDSKTVRRQNLATLRAQFGTLAKLELALHGKVTASYLSQIQNGYREMGDETARVIEEQLDLGLGWMDQPHPTTASRQVGPRGAMNLVTVQQVVSSELTGANVPATFSVPLLDIGASMGVGAVQPEYETIVGKLDLNQHWVRTRLPNVSSPHNLKIITGYGDSMAGTYEDGDLLFVDVGITDVQVDAVYAFALNGELYIKRLQKRPDETIMVLSDNPKYPPYAVTSKEEIRVIGRVVGGWNWRKL